MTQSLKEAIEKSVAEGDRAWKETIRRGEEAALREARESIARFDAEVESFIPWAESECGRFPSVMGTAARLGRSFVITHLSSEWGRTDEAKAEAIRRTLKDTGLHVEVVKENVSGRDMCDTLQSYVEGECRVWLPGHAPPNDSDPSR